MPDLGPALGAIMNMLGPLVGRVLKSFLATTVGMIVLGLLMAAAAFLVAFERGLLRGALAVVGTVAIFGVLGVMLAGKRAVASALVEGLETLGLGGRALDLVFQRGLEITGDGAMGERGVAVARYAERLPLAQAEAWLRGRVDALAREEPQGGGVRGWLRRSIRARLFAQVEKLTQAKFRDHGAQHGGVDLMRVRDELAGRIDQTLVDTLKAGMFKVTALLVAASMLGSALLTFAIATVRA